VVTKAAERSVIEKEKGNSAPNFMNHLVVIHRSKQLQSVFPATGLGLVEPYRANAFRMETCQRELWVFQSDESEDLAHSLRVLGVDIRVGASAYRFLLSFACGLESEVKGETDVFGQLKQAWQGAQVLQAGTLDDLVPWMNRVFEDTKEVRSRYLQNVGGASYGSLVRKILNLEAASDSDDGRGPILLVGAGQLAASVAPWLTDRHLMVWNRTEDRAHQLVSEMRSKPRSSVEVLTGSDQEMKAWSLASHVVICIPPDTSRDDLRVQAFLSSPLSGKRSVVHLGVMESELESDSVWSNVPHFYLLDDLFAMQKKSDEFRAAQFARAQKACEERSALRSMGGSLSVPHGWEDLALFA